MRSGSLQLANIFSLLVQHTCEKLSCLYYITQNLGFMLLFMLCFPALIIVDNEMHFSVVTLWQSVFPWLVWRVDLLTVFFKNLCNSSHSQLSSLTLLRLLK